MQKSQSSDPTITKLLEADADLAAQEAELSTQLKSIGEKRHSLKTVIDMFDPAHTTDTSPVAIPVAEEQLQHTTPEVAPKLNGASVDATEASTAR